MLEIRRGIPTAPEPQEPLSTMGSKIVNKHWERPLNGIQWEERSVSVVRPGNTPLVEHRSLKRPGAGEDGQEEGKHGVGSTT